MDIVIEMQVLKKHLRHCYISLKPVVLVFSMRRLHICSIVFIVLLIQIRLPLICSRLLCWISKSGNIGVYRGISGYIGVYRGISGYIGVYRGLSGYIVN